MVRKLLQLILAATACWTFAVSAQAQRALTNLSFRGDVNGAAAGAGMLAANFTIEGTASKTVLVRVAGPALATFGVQGALLDPILRVHDGAGALVATNSGWDGSQALSAAFANAGAFPFAVNSKDAAVLLTLPAGTYTASVGSVSGASGTALLEAYDPQPIGRLPYLSARNRVTPGIGTLTAGFFIAGPAPVTVLIRGLGPALGHAGVTGTLANPALTVLASNGSIVASNDNWGGGNSLSEAAATTGLMPLATGSNDAALLLTLAPGPYNVQLDGLGGSGLAMLEVAQIDPSRAASFVPAVLTPPREVELVAGQSATLAAPAMGKPTISYQWRRNGVAIAGATASSHAIAAAQASDSGSYTVALSNVAGTTVAAVATVQVGGGVSITTQPVAQTVAAGGTAVFNVAAVGSPAPSYQWLFNGEPIAGATQATLTRANVTAANAGQYSVRVTSGANTVTSASVALTVTGAGLAIVEQPVSQTVNAGGSATFRVTAVGDGALTYQWFHDGAAITGATQASFTLPTVQGANAGSYWVRVTDSKGSVISALATLVVRSREGLAGAYFGTLATDEIPFALLVRPDGTGAFLGYAPATQQGLIARDVRVTTTGQVQFTVTAVGGAGAAEYLVAGAISGDGQFAGSIAGLNLALVSRAASGSQATDRSGFYEGGRAGSAARSYAIVSAGGDIVSLTVEGSLADVGRGTVAPVGEVAIVNQRGGRTHGIVQGVVASLFATPFGGGTAQTYQLANTDQRTDVEKLVNISTRSQTGAGTEALIAGFVVSGEFSKSVLVRAIGPSLAQFGVGNPLSAARLEVYSGQTLVAQSTDWGTVANADDVAAAAVRVSAFPLARNSRDAALLLTLQPGAYTAIVSGQAEATGVSLVEVYDASVGTVPPGERIINIATRGVVGAGDQTLIAGFVITGRVPKRVLVRGVGPTLASSFGVSGVLARPRVAVLAGGGAEVVDNARWSNRPDAAEIAAAAQAAGAFPLAAGSEDAALIVNLPPGAYSAQVTDAGGGTASGVALVEVYELR